MSEITFNERASDPPAPSSGQWTIYTKAAGFFLIDDAGAVIGPFVASGSGVPVDDTTPLVRDPVDNTKQTRIDTGAVAPATTRTITMPNQDVDLAPNTGTYPAALHASRHADGGADELNVAGLSGLLADAQTPLAHATSHKHGGADEVATVTPAGNEIPKSAPTGLLADGWLADATETLRGILEVATDGETQAGSIADDKIVTPLKLNTRLNSGVQNTPQQASEIVVGGGELATQAEVDAGVDDLRIVTPLKLKNTTLPFTPLAHAASHQHGGADEVAVAAAVANGIPKALATALLAQTWLPGVKDLHYKSNLAMASNNTSVFVNFLSMNVTNTHPNGLNQHPFFVFAAWTVRQTNNTTDWGVRVRFGGLDLVVPGDTGEAREEPNDGGANQRHVRGIFRVRNTAGGSVTPFTLDFRAPNGGNVEMYQAEFIAFRLAEFPIAAQP